MNGQYQIQSQEFNERPKPRNKANILIEVEPNKCSSDWLRGREIHSSKGSVVILGYTEQTSLKPWSVFVISQAFYDLTEGAVTKGTKLYYTHEEFINLLGGCILK